MRLFGLTLPWFTFASVTFTGLLTVLFLNNHDHEEFTRTWHRIRYQTSNDRYAYEAPLHCVHGENIPDLYKVLLAPGYSLEHHKETIGYPDEITFPITSVLRFPGSPDVISYAATMDVASLAIVRADLSVSLVECDYKPTIPEDGIPGLEPGSNMDSIR